MFASLGNTINFLTSPTLVATTLPNSIALRAPYDSVAPSVSSAKLDNNASGNSISLPKSDESQLPVPANIATEKSFLSTNTNSASFAANAQTAFLTQLASGDISPEVYGIFVQYDRLISYANVKYKPSNAGKPVDPVGLFSALLQLEKENSVNSPQIDDKLSLPTNAELPTSTESSQIYTKIEPIQAQDPQPTKEVPLPQLKVYNTTIINNRDVMPNDLESA